MPELRYELLAAIIGEHEVKVKELLKSCDVDSDARICTRSMSAKKSNVTRISRDDQLIILAVAVKKSPEILKLLLSKGFNCNNQGPGSSGLLLLEAIDTHDIETVKIILEQGADVNEKLARSEVLTRINPDKGSTALHYAAQQGCVDIFKLLLDLGADISARSDEDKLSAMQYAASEDHHTEIIKILLERGASIDGRDSHGDSPLSRAIQSYEIEVALEMLKRVSTDVKHPIDYLHHALAKSREIDIDILDDILDVPGFADSEETATVNLHLAVNSNDEELVKVFLDRGARINNCDKRGFEALYKSVANKNRRIFEMLLQHGASATLPNSKLILHTAVCKGQVVIFESLLRHGCDINATDKHGRTPLDIAKLQGYFFFCELLIKRLIMYNFNNLDACAKQYERIEDNARLVNFWGECIQEMSLLKSNVIDDTCVSYADILLSEFSTNQLAMYAANKTIAEEMFVTNIQCKFPVYYCLLHEKFADACARYSLLQECKVYLPVLLSKWNNSQFKLPDVCTYIVFSYLNNNDLNNFKEACRKSPEKVEEKLEIDTIMGTIEVIL